MREVVLDTETTGLDPDSGHRIVEIGCVELINHVATGRHFQSYVNPERDMPEEARAIHGLSTELLSKHPVFAKVVDPFLEFIGDAPLVIHNAQFDLRFLNAELAKLERAPLDPSRAVDTVALARQRLPGAQVNLDALCRRFEIDASERTFHGALLDCQLLAEVYLELRGGRQPGFDLGKSGRGGTGMMDTRQRPVRPPRPHGPTAEETAAHDALLATIKDPIWRQ